MYLHSAKMSPTPLSTCQQTMCEDFAIAWKMFLVGWGGTCVFDMLIAWWYIIALWTARIRTQSNTDACGKMYVFTSATSKWTDYKKCWLVWSSGHQFWLQHLFCMGHLVRFKATKWSSFVFKRQTSPESLRCQLPWFAPKFSTSKQLMRRFFLRCACHLRNV